MKDIQKSILYSFYVEGAEYERILPFVTASRERNKELIENILNVKIQPLDEKVLDQPGWGNQLEGWNSKISSGVLTEKLGEVSGIAVVDALFKPKRNEKDINGQEIIISYFDDNPKFDRETEEVDFYQFIGFTEKEIIR